MNGRDLLAGMGCVDEALVAAAETPWHRRRSLPRVLLIAACVCLLLAGSALAVTAALGIRVTELVSGWTESKYLVETDIRYLSADDLSPQAWDAVRRSWEAWRQLDWQQQALSSSLPGSVARYFDTWAEAEEFLGISLDNPLEQADWLTEGNYFGYAKDAPGLTGTDSGKHCHVSLYGSSETSIESARVQAGYLAGDVRVMLQPALDFDSDRTAAGGVWAEKVKLRSDTYRMGDGQTAVIVDTAEPVGQDAELRQTMEAVLDCFGT
jgi:hypothetical protein